MAINQEITAFQYYNMDNVLSETQKAVFKASKYFKNLNSCLEGLSGEIDLFNNAQLTAEIVYSEESADKDVMNLNSGAEKSFFYKPTSESVKTINSFKKNIAQLLKEYYSTYFSLNKHFQDFESNFTYLNKLINYIFERNVGQEYNHNKSMLQPIHNSIQTLKENIERNAKKSQMVSDLESLIHNIPGESGLFENMRLIAFQTLNAVKTYDSNRVNAKLDELVKQYNELVLPLRAQFMEITSFEDKLFNVRADFIKLLENCKANTENVKKLVDNLNPNIYFFSTDFPCSECDKHVIDEPVAFSMNKTQFNEYIIRLKESIISRFSGEINCSNTFEFRAYLEKLFDTLKDEPINFVSDKKELIVSLKGELLKKFLLAYDDAPSEFKFSKKEFEKFRSGVAREVASKIEKEIKDNLECSLTREDDKFLILMNLFEKKTGILSKRVKKNRAFEFLIDENNGLEKQVHKDIESIEKSNEVYIYFKDDRERISLLRKDLHLLAGEIENFDNELTPSNTRVSDAFENMLVKQRKKEAVQLAEKFNKYMSIPWLKRLGEDALLNKQLILDGLRYAFSRKKNILYRGFDYIGDKVRDEFFKLSDLVADKLKIPKKILPHSESHMQDILLINDKAPKTSEELSFLFNKVREEYYLQSIKKKGLTSPGNDIVSNVSKRPNINNAYEIKYLLDDKLWAPTKEFLTNKLSLAKDYLAEKIVLLKEKFNFKEKDDEEPSIMEKIKTFIKDNVTNPWYNRLPQLDNNFYDSLKNNADKERSNPEAFYQKLSINTIPIYEKGLFDKAVDLINRFKQSRVKPKKIIDAFSNEPVILARMKDDYCLHCFETLDKSSAVLSPKKAVIDAVNEAIIENNIREELKKPFIPMLVADETLLSIHYYRKYYCGSVYEPEEGYGLYPLLEV